MDLLQIPDFVLQKRPLGSAFAREAEYYKKSEEP
jgi:hypothetical protein